MQRKRKGKEARAHSKVTNVLNYRVLIESVNEKRTARGNLGKNIGGFSVLLALAFLALDFAIYFTLAW